MSVIGRAGARLGGVGNLHRLRLVTQIAVSRNISWMAFEAPDPALYQAPTSLQPKRPIAAEAVPDADGTSPSAQPITMAGRVVSPPSAVASSRVSASGKVIPASVPASAMRTGPVPLSQIQKRTFVPWQPAYTDDKHPFSHKDIRLRRKAQSDAAKDKTSAKREEQPKQPTQDADDNSGHSLPGPISCLGCFSENPEPQAKPEKKTNKLPAEPPTSRPMPPPEGSPVPPPPPPEVHFPTLLVRIPGDPATWPVELPPWEYEEPPVRLAGCANGVVLASERSGTVV